MRLLLTAAAAGVLLAAQAAQADVSLTLTGVTDYDFRGVSLNTGGTTSHDTLADNPALQGSFDYSHGIFYASVWGSQIDYGPDYDGNIEIDLVAGLTGETDIGLRWDVGATYYTYPGSDSSEGDPQDPDDDVSEIEPYWEFYAGGGYGPVDLKVWYSPNYADVDETAWYVEGNASFDLPAEFSVNFHAGYSFGNYWDSLADDAAADDPDYDTYYGGDKADYYDFSVGLARSFGHFDCELKTVWTDTDKYFQVDEGPFRNDLRIIFQVSTTLPWGSDEG